MGIGGVRGVWPARHLPHVKLIPLDSKVCGQRQRQQRNSHYFEEMDFPGSSRGTWIAGISLAVCLPFLLETENVHTLWPGNYTSRHLSFRNAYKKHKNKEQKPFTAAGFALAEIWKLVKYNKARTNHGIPCRKEKRVSSPEGREDLRHTVEWKKHNENLTCQNFKWHVKVHMGYLWKTGPPGFSAFYRIYFLALLGFLQ